jgi:hypothetical protein
MESTKSAHPLSSALSMFLVSCEIVEGIFSMNLPWALEIEGERIFNRDQAQVNLQVLSI